MSPIDAMYFEGRLRRTMNRRMFLACCIASATSVDRAASSQPPVYLAENAKPFIELKVPWLQSFALDEVTDEIYVQFVRPKRKWLTEVHRLKRAPNGTFAFLDKQLPTRVLGHQSLSLERTNREVAFWMSAPGAGWSAVRFKYVPAGEPAAVDDYVLFDRSFLPASLNVAVSHDQKWLVAVSRVRELGRSQNKLRIFDLRRLQEAGGGDHAANYVAEWNVHSEPGFPIQGLACSKEKIFVIYGHSGVSLPKPLAVYDYNGNLLSFQPDVRTGRAHFIRVKEGTNYEPEGLCIANIRGHTDPSLFLGINGGGRSERVSHVYHLGHV